MIPVELPPPGTPPPLPSPAGEAPSAGLMKLSALVSSEGRAPRKTVLLALTVPGCAAVNANTLLLVNRRRTDGQHGTCRRDHR